MSTQPRPPSPLCVLPNGEAVRAEEVQRILIEPSAAPPRLEGQRFAVVLAFADGARRRIATGLTRADATDLARRCARALGEPGGAAR
ncbi:MAG: hypothetical protein NZ555_08655 [Geminicoccaceae bacterium]|nr:hypothetical protein [Geminicoccaceae bacterium]MCX8102651.1 hypothetical protein [Geminicoccaceae bacterium]MDW8369820.1 hypothetical protein [Geminicoccaceae bacterium]